MSTLWRLPRNEQIAEMAAGMIPFVEAHRFADEAMRQQYLRQLQGIETAGRDNRIALPFPRGIMTPFNWVIREQEMGGAPQEAQDREDDLYACFYAPLFPIVPPDVEADPLSNQGARADLIEQLRFVHRIFEVRDEVRFKEWFMSALAAKPLEELHSFYGGWENKCHTIGRVWRKIVDEKKGILRPFDPDRLVLETMYDGCRIRPRWEDTLSFIYFDCPGPRNWYVSAEYVRLNGAWRLLNAD